MAERRVTDGARALRAYVDAHFAIGGVPRFCEERRLNRIAVQRALNGERQRISVDFAIAVAKATDGAVPVESWRSETATGEKPERRVAA